MHSRKIGACKLYGSVPLASQIGFLSLLSGYKTLEQAACLNRAVLLMETAAAAATTFSDLRIGEQEVYFACSSGDNSKESLLYLFAWLLFA